MNEEQLAIYKAQCERVRAMTRYDYNGNPELDELMLETGWKAFYKQHLTSQERKKVQSYLIYMKDPSVGCLDSQIDTWNALVQRIKQLQKKLSKPKK